MSGGRVRRVVSWEGTPHAAMWQVNGFDRRCFQLGCGFRISSGAVTAVTSHEGLSGSSFGGGSLDRPGARQKDIWMPWLRASNRSCMPAAP